MSSQPISRWSVRPLLAFGALSLASALTPAIAQESPAEGPTGRPTFVSDAKAYVTSPLHWDGRDWLYFGGSLAAIGVAHHYDDQVRTHFTTGNFTSNLTKSSSNEAKDALPAVAVVGATW